MDLDFENPKLQKKIILIQKHNEGMLDLVKLPLIEKGSGEVKTVKSSRLKTPPQYEIDEHSCSRKKPEKNFENKNTSSNLTSPFILINNEENGRNIKSKHLSTKLSSNSLTHSTSAGRLTRIKSCNPS